MRPATPPGDPTLSRRSFVSTAVLGTASLIAGCEALGITSPTASGSARLTARPGTPTSSGALGLRALGLGNSLADGMVYVPASYKSASPAPLVLLLHGAGGVSSSFILPWMPIADTTGQILLAVDSRRVTWDGVGDGKFGPDIAFLNQALTDTFSKYAVSASRVAVAGFSDGATMSLAVGLANGDLFSKVIALSPGGLIGREHRGKPAFYLAHGSLDPVINLRVTRDEIVPKLEKDGYVVTYREFAGGHVIQDDLRTEAMVWAAG
ncbi:MAG: phospholipase [Gemmatimonadaceae bacterium]|nr:phospholipase [Gemmatimonadaceae bacterium]